MNEILRIKSYYGIYDGTVECIWKVSWDWQRGIVCISNMLKLQAFMFSICIYISLKYVSLGPINNKLAFTQVMTLHWTGDQPHLDQWLPCLMLQCIFVLPGLNELRWLMGCNLHLVQGRFMKVNYDDLYALYHHGSWEQSLTKPRLDAVIWVICIELVFCFFDCCAIRKILLCIVPFCDENQLYFLLNDFSLWCRKQS